MSWTVTKLSESSESMVFRCVASAAVARPADIDGGDDPTIDISAQASATLTGTLVTHIEYVEWNCPDQISATASGLLTIDYHATSSVNPHPDAPQIVLQLSGSGSMGVNTPGVIAKPADTAARSFNGDIVLTTTGACTLVMSLRKISGF